MRSLTMTKREKEIGVAFEPEGRKIAPAINLVRAVARYAARRDFLNELGRASQDVEEASGDIRPIQFRASIAPVD